MDIIYAWSGPKKMSGWDAPIIISGKSPGNKSRNSKPMCFCMTDLPKENDCFNIFIDLLYIEILNFVLQKMVYVHIKKICSGSNQLEHLHASSFCQKDAESPYYHKLSESSHSNVSLEDDFKQVSDRDCSIPSQKPERKEKSRLCFCWFLHYKTSTFRLLQKVKEETSEHN